MQAIGQPECDPGNGIGCRGLPTGLGTYCNDCVRAFLDWRILQHDVVAENLHCRPSWIRFPADPFTDGGRSEWIIAGNAAMGVVR